MKYPLLALAACASLLAACAHEPENTSAHVALGPAYGTEPPPSKAPKITQYADQNHDGKVTREEAKVDPLLAKNFDHYDLDHNNVLDRGEFARLEDASRMGTAGSTGWIIEEPGAMPYDAAASSYSEGNPSLNRTGVDQVRPAGQP